MMQWDFGKGWKGSTRAAITHHPDKFDPECKDPDRLCPYAVFANMKKKGYRPHYKDQESTMKGKPKMEFRQWLEADMIRKNGYYLLLGYYAYSFPQDDPEAAVGGEKTLYKYKKPRRLAGDEPRAQKVYRVSRNDKEYVTKGPFATEAEALQAFQDHLTSAAAPAVKELAHLSLQYHYDGRNSDVAYWNRGYGTFGEVKFTKPYQHLASHIKVPKIQAPAVAKDSWGNTVDPEAATVVGKRVPGTSSTN